jgi:hypothetical protein
MNPFGRDEMRRKNHTTLGTHSLGSFLRSISIRQDACAPERIAHYRPTGKGVVLIRALAGLENDRVFMITAPYGSGKSLSATFLLHLVENSPSARPVVRKIVSELLCRVDDHTGAWAGSRIRSMARGLVLVIEGAQQSVPKAIFDALREAATRQRLRGHSFAKAAPRTIDESLEMLRAFGQFCGERDIAPVTIIWDEFGRHLEHLVASGRAGELADIQQLAEFVARERRVPFLLGMLLHQGMLRYASNLGDAVRAEWTKIEGRFRSIQYVDDSPEVYRLIGELVAAKRKGRPADTTKMMAAARLSKKLGLFPDLGIRELAAVLENAYPLEPATLYLLPRLAARVAQNERTMFDFLNVCPVAGKIEPKDLFDYFSPAMQEDTVVGGTYRQWLETQSALSKIVGSPLEEEALKTTCLLSLGIAGERFRTSRELLTFAVNGLSTPNGAESTIRGLIEKRLLLHRVHHDAVSVWHGTDADLRGKLKDEMDRRRPSFDLIDYLSDEFPPGAWRPVEYNAEYGVRRFFQSEFRRPTPLSLEGLRRESQADGRVVYFVCENSGEREAARALSVENDDPRTMTVVPKRPIQLSEIALEVCCLQEMQEQPAVVGEDPLVLPELKQMTDDARSRLQRLVENQVRPSQDGPHWYHQGRALDLCSDSDLRRYLSRIAERCYNKTPKFRNEMIVRRKPSAVVVNSRKRLVMAVLERSGTDGLGIEGNFPDASIFRTVLLHTGLYRKRGGKWGYADPTELKDPGLREVWDKIRRFVVEPEEKPKRPSDLLQQLLRPPIGIREGVIPVLVAAGFKAFPGLRTLLRDGAYVEDLTPSEIEHLCKEPDRYVLKVYEVNNAKAEFLRGLVKVFSGDQATSVRSDLVRHAFDSMANWRDKLPPACLTSQQVSSEGRTLQGLLRASADPVTVLLERFPVEFRHSINRPEVLLECIRRGIHSIEAVVPGYLERAQSALESEFVAKQEFRSLRDRCRWWASNFDLTVLRRELSGSAKGLLQRLITEYDTDAALITGIAVSIGMQTPSRWEDASPRLFAETVRGVIQEVEDAALRTGTCSGMLGHLVEGRIITLLERFIQVRGDNEARQLLERLKIERFT